MALSSRVDSPSVDTPTTDPATTDSPLGSTAPGGTSLTGLRTYNPDGTWTVSPLTTDPLTGRQPRLVGDIWGSPDSWYVSPYYQEGDENRPYNNEELAGSMLGLLYSAGYISQSVAGRGVWTSTAASALSRAMADANRYGVSVEEFLSTIAKNGNASSGGSGGLGPAPMTDEDIKAIGNKVAQGVLGRNLNDQEIGNFIPAFRGAIAGGTTPATAGENVVRGSNPAEAYAHDAGNVMQTISKLLGG